MSPGPSWPSPLGHPSPATLKRRNTPEHKPTGNGVRAGPETEHSYGLSLLFWMNLLRKKLPDCSEVSEEGQAQGLPECTLETMSRPSRHSTAFV